MSRASSLVALTLVLVACRPSTPSTPPEPPVSPDPPAPWVAEGPWQAIAGTEYPGKQDDVVFVSPKVGFYGNGSGAVLRTDDGGDTWRELWKQPGTYVRALGFLDERRGFLGNLGPDYFPGVTDDTMLYRTDDGGEHWTKVALPDTEGARGVCAIDVLSVDFINAGVRGHKEIVHVGGRVGGPASLYRSDDAGDTWKRIALPPEAAMILDVKFVDVNTGFVFAGSDPNVEVSNAVIVKTTDSGRTWRVVYRSARPFELTWKASFPTREVGYATLQSYNPDPALAQRYVLKTADAGDTWQELPLVVDPKVQTFGVGFVDERHGWVGGVPQGFETKDGGATWTAAPELGVAANKIRVVVDGDARAVFGIGKDLRRLRLRR
jgi:photosystem II stability/assembly factor-like uncharacterized protein